MNKFAHVAASALAVAIVGAALIPENATAVAAAERDATGDAERLKAGIRRALTDGNAPLAVQLAETAVAGRTRDADLRVMLGDSYMAEGRFASAASAFADALTLDASLNRASLSLALAQIASGQQGAARDTLARASGIPASDHGLALALAGDTDAAVAMLGDLVRGGTATAKTRQNLALALALGGNWQDARVVVGQDLPSDEADRRMVEWAALARPGAGMVQVATLLGVTPAAADPGLPVRLALASDAGVQQLAAAPPAVAGPVAVAAVAAETQPAMPLVEAGAAIRTASVVFLPAREIVQALPANYARGGERVMMAARTVGGRAAPAETGGQYVVQIGAYENSAIATEAWERLRRRMRVLANYTPSSAPVPAGAWGNTRLAVGRFASEGEARQLCASLRGQGQRCFVRAVAGDVALRVNPAQRFAKL